MEQSNKLLQDRFVNFTRRLLFILICIGIFMMLTYHCYFFPQKLSYKMAFSKADNKTQDYLINTPGCYIPNYAKTYKYGSLKKKKLRLNGICGVRYIFIDTLRDDFIKFQMYNYTQEGIRCCYRFAKESPIPGHEHVQLSYTPCEFFTNNTIVWLQQEIVTVTCTNKTLLLSGKSKMKIIYEDNYIILKRIDESDSQSETNNKGMQWNVLMIGLDSMSRTRVFDTMPHTTKYLKKHKWLDFKAYQKVGNNTFQNLMSVLTGKRTSSIYSNCTSDLDKCADFFIWEKYKYDGYKTAHGESNYLSETSCSGFKNSPTDHYMRPFLRTMTSNSEEILCMGKKPCATHLLEYAHNFVDSYKTNTFFGIFWIDTYTSYKYPQLSDTEIVDFFRKLYNSGVLNNTFVIFFSDQGTSFGKKRHPVESYYDNQLPMLFVWTPLEFRRQYTDKHYNLQVNQERLITPYDVHITLADIHKLSTNSSEEIRSEACPQCTSLFERVSPQRTCADAGAGGTWCSCHNMSRVATDDQRVESSISAAVAHIQKIRNSIKTIPCTSCQKLKYPTIFRAHEYHESNKTYHVIAFYMSPNELEFEAVVVHNGAHLEVQTVRSLTRYNDRGHCAVHSQNRPFCVCAFDTSCVPETKDIQNFSNLSDIEVMLL